MSICVASKSAHWLQLTCMQKHSMYDVRICEIVNGVIDYACTLTTVYDELSGVGGVGGHCLGNVEGDYLSKHDGGSDVTMAVERESRDGERREP